MPQNCTANLQTLSTNWKKLFLKQTRPDKQCINGNWKHGAYFYRNRTLSTNEISRNSTVFFRKLLILFKQVNRPFQKSFQFFSSLKLFQFRFGENRTPEITSFFKLLLSQWVHRQLKDHFSLLIWDALIVKLFTVRNPWKILWLLNNDTKFEL